jgi:FixJ family two-component response regulator
MTGEHTTLMPDQKVVSIFADLSARQMEVVNLLCRGYSNKNASKVLGLSEQTFKNHSTKIYILLHHAIPRDRNKRSYLSYLVGLRDGLAAVESVDERPE